jgi:hypothetical protein
MIFKHCAGRGYVNEYVLNRLRHLCPELYRRLTNLDPRKEPSMDAIPDEWKRHNKEFGCHRR